MYTYGVTPAPVGMRPVGMTAACRYQTWLLAPNRFVTRVDGKLNLLLDVSKTELTVLRNEPAETYVGNGEGAALGAVGRDVGDSVGGAPTGVMHDRDPGARVTFPSRQTSHCCAPTEFTASPRGQSLHALCWADAAKLPGLQGEQK